MTDKKLLSGYKAVMGLIKELGESDKKYWIDVIGICLKEHIRTRGDFAGSWVFNEMKKRGMKGFNNLRPLSSRSIIEKTDNSRKGRRAYYKIPDLEGVELALREVSYDDGKVGSIVKVPLFIDLIPCGSPSISDVHTDKYFNVDVDFIKPGYKYFVVQVSGDSMDLAGIKEGDRVLFKSQGHADIGKIVLFCNSEGVSIKKLQNDGNKLVLSPISSNPEHKSVLFDDSVIIQGVFIEKFPSQNN